jgi:hypothetical protein
MWKKSISLLLFLFFVVLSVATYKYVYQKHRNIHDMDADFKSVPQELHYEFENNGNVATKKYLNKIIVITGIVSEKDSESITLNDKILCYLSTNTDKNFETKIAVKGRCIGFDELLEVVKLDECSLVKK